MLVSTISFDNPRQTGCIQRIIFPGAGEIRSRNIATRSRQRAAGWYFSWKSPHKLEWESGGELSAFRLLDADPTVLRFFDQPCRIEYVQDGVLRAHIPDILVEFTDRKEFWEVKLAAEATEAEFVERTTLMSDLNHWGFGYRMVISEELRAEPRLQNVKRLLYWGGVRAVTPPEREFIRLELIERHALLWSDACAGALGQYGREILCRLSMEGMLTFNLSNRWTDGSLFVASKDGR